MPRPPQREVSTPAFLDLFVEYDRALRRIGKPASITRTGFAKKHDWSITTLRGYLTDGNLPFPPVSPGDLVLLLDDAPPHELLWLSNAWCELCGRTWDELQYKPASYLRQIGLADGPREMHQAVARELRGGRTDGCGEVDGWIRDATDRYRAVTFELRYGRRANAFYVRAHLIEMDGDVHAAEVFNVEPGVILRRKPRDQVELVDLERLWRDHIPPYKLPSQ